MSFPNDQGKPGGATPSYLTAQNSALHVDSAARVLKASSGTIVSMNVLVAGSAPGAVFDTASAASLTTASTAQLVAVIPNTVGPVSLQFPCLVGIAILPGAGQAVSVAYT